MVCFGTFIEKSGEIRIEMSIKSVLDVIGDQTWVRWKLRPLWTHFWGADRPTRSGAHQAHFSKIFIFFRRAKSKKKSRILKNVPGGAKRPTRFLVRVSWEKYIIFENFGVRDARQGAADIWHRLVTRS